MKAYSVRLLSNFGLHHVSNRSSRFAFGVALSTLFVLAACGKQNPSLPADVLETPHIIGGAPVEASDPIGASVVALVLRSPGGLGICTGSLIDKNVILTAAHCVIPGASNILVVFGRDLNDSEHVQIRKTLAVKYHPKFERQNEDERDAGDIGLLRFEGEAPEGYRPVQLATARERYIVGQSVTLAGYGITDGVTHEGAAVLRKVNVKIESTTFSPSELLVDQTQGRGACHGDSGGPAYLKKEGRLVLIGITSRGVNDDDDTCSHSGAYTSVKAYSDWIQTEVKKLPLTAKVEAR